MSSSATLEQFDGSATGAIVCPSGLAQVVVKFVCKHGWRKSKCYGSAGLVVPIEQCIWPGTQDGESRGSLISSCSSSSSQSMLAVFVTIPLEDIEKFSTVFATEFDSLSSTNGTEHGDGQVKTVRWVPNMRLTLISSMKKIHSSTIAVVEPKPTSASSPQQQVRSFTAIELFAGVGGFRLGVEAAGGASVFATDYHPDAVAMFTANVERSSSASTTLALDVATLLADITLLHDSEIPPHDLLTGGFPCQSFCKAGQQRGLRDPRGSMFYEVVRLLRAKKPKCFLLENVENLIHIDDGDTFAAILKALTTDLHGGMYEVHHQVLDAAHWVAQTRRRVYIVGIRKDIASRVRGKLSALITNNPLLSANPTCIVDLASTPDPCQNRFTLASSVLEPTLNTVEAATAAGLLLNAVQLEHVRSTASWRRNPTWRLCDLRQGDPICDPARKRGKARTLMSSYRHGYKFFSEFVPLGPLPTCFRWPDDEDQEPDLGALQQLETPNLNSDGRKRSRVEGTTAADSAESSSAADQPAKTNDSTTLVDPKGKTINCHYSDEEMKTFNQLPLRFFSHRECSRIQGFPETFYLGAGASAGAVNPHPPLKLSSPHAPYRLLGNAVVPPVIESIVRNLKPFLEEPVCESHP